MKQEIRPSRWLIPLIVALSVAVPAGAAYIQLHDGDVTTSKIANGAVTKIKIEPMPSASVAPLGNFAVSAVVTTVSVTGTTPGDLTGLSVTLTTNGRPVEVGLFNEVGAINVYSGLTTANSASSATTIGYWAITDGSNTIERQYETLLGTNSSGTASTLLLPCDSIHTTVFKAAGTYTWKLRGRGGVSTDKVQVDNCRMYAVER